MEALTIWEQHTATLCKDPRRGFGIAISGGRDRPSAPGGSVVVSDVVPGGPAEGRLLTGDHIVMVNGVSVESVSSAFVIQILRTCAKVANVTVKRPRRVQLPATKASPSSPGHPDSDEEDGPRRLEEPDHGQGYEGDSSSGSGHSPGERSRRVRAGRRSRASSRGRRSPGGGSEAPGLALVSGFKRLPRQDVLMKPLKSVLVKRKDSEEFGVKLGSQIFIKHITESGLAARHRGLQEGDLILQINGVSSENLSLSDTRRLIEKSEGQLTLLVLRDRGQFLVNIPPAVSDSDSSVLEDISDLTSELSQAPPSHIPPPPRQAHRPQRPRGTWGARARCLQVDSAQLRAVPLPRAEQLASLEAAQRAVGLGPGPSGASNARAEFWRLRGLRRGAKKTTQRSREDLSTLTRQGRYPPYERVVLREASFKRPVVILGPVADIAMHKLTADLPGQFEIAESISRTDSPSKIIKLDTVRVIAEKDKHALLDVTPSAIERLNYVQYYPIVIFCAPESRAALKALREWLAPASRRSSRRLYAQAQKLRKHSSHLFTATIALQGTSDAWYQELKATIQEQQTRPIWTAEDQLDGSSEDNLDLPHCGLAGSSADLSCDSRANSDYETDGEGCTDGEGGPHTDVEEGPPAPALARSSEPVQLDEPQSPRHPGDIPAHRGPQVNSRHPQGQWRQDSMRTYEREALRRKFTRARDAESSDEEGYDWGPATDL
ncbi:tight junction protein ZO-3 [Marmota marmota marmota]|uniref:Tight junction protein 3 n=1 Tax=Marmota marmota marmota TaxID=9994 RepID=A0A8C5ZTJ7_MARMA|nr:tight junction protein ZO-3 [Marmota marmota marmota]